MSLDLLPSAPIRTDADDDTARLRDPLATSCQSAAAEPDCPYCSGPETD